MKTTAAVLSACLVASSAYGKGSAPAHVGRPYAPVIWELTDDVIGASLKCEIGQLAYDFGKTLPTRFSLAQVTIKLQNTKEEKGGIDLKLPWFSTAGSVSRDRIVDKGEEVVIVYNISKANAQRNCIKNNKFEVGVYSCLKSKLKLFASPGVEPSGGIECSSSVNVKRVSSGQMGMKVWAINVGPSASSSETGMYTFDVSVPPKEAEKSK